MFITRNRRTRVFCSFCCCYAILVLVVIIKLKLGIRTRLGSRIHLIEWNIRHTVVGRCRRRIPVRWDTHTNERRALPTFKRMPMNTFSISMDDDDDDGTRRASHFTYVNTPQHTCINGARPTVCCLICYSHCVTENNCMIWWQYCRLSSSVNIVRCHQRWHPNVRHTHHAHRPHNRQ